MIIGELEGVRPLDAIELHIRQARRDLTTPGLRQATRRLHAQSGTFTHDHAGTIVLQPAARAMIRSCRAMLRGWDEDEEWRQAYNDYYEAVRSFEGGVRALHP
jgi:hypothetical protein